MLFRISLKWNAPFHRATFDYSGAYWDGFFDNVRHVSCGGIFNMASSAAASEFCKIQVGMDVFIPHLGQASLIFMLFT